MDIVQRVEAELTESGADVMSVGKSETGKDILCAHVGGYDGKQIILTAGIHARECYTSLVAIEQIKAFGAATDGGGAYIIPLVNPDGALFFETGDAQGSEVLERFSALRKSWKANALGVDLNCNFDANWGTGRGNRNFPYSHGFIGDEPESAKETAALVSFTKKVMPAFTLSYHCKGGELYWEFFQSRADKKRDKKIATAIAKHIGVKRVDGDLCSAGGYKDWCVMRLGIPSVTVELIRRGAHPFKAEDFTEPARINADLPRFILKLMRNA